LATVPSLIIAAVGIVALGVFVALAYRRRWQWTGLPAADGVARQPKTLWNWLELLGIPVALAALAFLLNDAQTQRDQRREDQRAAQQHTVAADVEREKTLRTYLAQMSDLMLIHRLLRPHPRVDVREVARTATLTAARRLDGPRRGLVVRFLAEAGLLHGGGGLFTHARVDVASADFKYAELPSTVLVQANLSRANLTRANLHRGRLDKAILFGAILDGAVLDLASLVRANLADASLSKAKLRRADLVQVDLTAAHLGGADLRRADLFRAELCLTDLAGANLSRADLSGANLRGADLRRANLSRADLGGANLRDADLRRANLHGAILQDAKLHGASFRGANLRAANFHGANLHRANLRGPPRYEDVTCRDTTGAP
jgi:uncharacterized protein YjbI with pentapeptide repeats